MGTPLIYDKFIRQLKEAGINVAPKKRTRYDNLLDALDELTAVGVRHLRYLEVGTYDGKRAAGLLKNWLSRGSKFMTTYYGFDLFEDLTPEMSAAELSKPKPPPSAAQAYHTLEETGAIVHLCKGNTRETLPDRARGMKADLVFLDGGHSLETIAHDWSNVNKCVIGVPHAIILLDDYFLNRDDYGCKMLVETVIRPDPAWSVELLDPVDSFAHTQLDIRMVRVRRIALQP